MFQKLFPKVYAKITGWRRTVIRPIKIQRVELLSADQIATALTGVAKAIRVLAVLFLFYIYLTTVLGIFPWTRGISASLLGAVLSTLSAIGQAFATYLALFMKTSTATAHTPLRQAGMRLSGMPAGGLVPCDLNVLFKDASVARGSARPSRLASPQFRHEAS